MRLQNRTVLTGAMLSLAVSALSVSPAMARPTSEIGSNPLLSQMEPTDTDPTQPGTMPPTDTDPTQPGTMPQTEQPVTGKIVSVTGEKVTLETADGTRDIMVSQQDIDRLQLEPGMEIGVILDDQNRATSVGLASEMNRSTTIRREEQTIERRTTTETAPAPTRTTTPPATTPEAAPTPEPETQTQEDSQPVRALW
jgi:hypothetical protein